VKERPKRKALRRPRKTDKEGADVTCWDRLFQVRAAATGKPDCQLWTAKDSDREKDAKKFRP